MGHGMNVRSPRRIAHDLPFASRRFVKLAGFGARRMDHHDDAQPVGQLNKSVPVKDQRSLGLDDQDPSPVSAQVRDGLAPTPG